MEDDRELENWRRQWQVEGEVPQDLRRRVERDVRKMRYGIVGSVGVTVVMGGGTIAMAASSGRPAVIVLAVATWIFIVAAWLAAILIDGWRIRKPAAMTTTAYLNFSIHRCRAGQRSIAAAFVLGVPFTTFTLIWTYYERSRIAALDVLAYVVSARVIVIGLVAAFAIALGVWRWRILRRERQYLILLRQAIADNPPRGPEERAGISS